MEDKKTFFKRLAEVQKKLKAPKNQFNKFGNYRYRNCEDILEALKELLCDNDLLLVIEDDAVEISSRFYIKSKVTVYDCLSDLSIHSFGLARECEDKKGMDQAQVTGASSSYARKYALNAMFCIDDTKDPDATNDHGNNYSAKKSNTLDNLEKYREPLAYAYKSGRLTQEEQDHMKKIGHKKDLEEYKKAYSSLMKRLFDEAPDEKKEIAAKLIGQDDLKSLLEI